MDAPFLDGILTTSNRKDVKTRDVKFCEKKTSGDVIQEVKEVTPKVSQIEKRRAEELREKIAEISKFNMKTRLGIRVAAFAVLVILAMYIFAVISRDLKVRETV